MKKTNPLLQGFDQLPHTLPVFPLANVVVMPTGSLPLNIFEPRYLNMVQDAFQTHRLIGMIQPQDTSTQPELHKVGCAGRITRYEEANDGRIEITLTGLCRFEISNELECTRGYRLVIPDWSNYAHDYDEQPTPDASTHSSFINALHRHFEDKETQLDWKVIQKLDTAGIFNTLLYFLDLSSDDRQMLLEIDTVEQRIKAVTAILESDKQDSLIQH